MESDIQSPCNICGHSTYHQSMFSHKLAPSDDYACSHSFEVIQCLGCKSISFREIFIDYEGGYPDSNGEWDYPITTTQYPEFRENKNLLDELSLLPDIVMEIYKETIYSINNKNFLLSSLGLRAIVEAVCNEKGISGRNLESRITEMAKKGLISRNDSKLLHAIRFMGNDAAHDIKKPREEQISAALKIVHHLLQSTYIIPYESEGKLDTMTDFIEESIKIMEKNFKSINKGNEIPIAKILGKDTRRIAGGINNLEKEIIDRILAKSYTKLSIGKVDFYESSQAKIQHFIVN